MIELAILGLLKERPMHGYQLNRELSEQLGGLWRVSYGSLYPSLRRLERDAVRRKLKAVFQQYDSQPVGRVIAEINPILRGWVNYFRIGHAARCFAAVRYWVEQKVRRHLMRARALASAAIGLRGLPKFCEGSTRTRIFCRVASCLLAITVRSATNLR